MQIAAQDAGTVTLRLGVDRAWLLDEGREFPVTVDPVCASATARPTFDAFVQTNISTDRSSEQELKVRAYDGTNKARSFLTFSNASFKNLKIQSATLNLYETWVSPHTQLATWHTESRQRTRWPSLQITSGNSYD